MARTWIFIPVRITGRIGISDRITDRRTTAVRAGMIMIMGTVTVMAMGTETSQGRYRSGRSIGSGNSVADAQLNASGTEFGRIGPAQFADGISVPVGGNNPRTISNLVVGAGDADVANPEGVSAFMYAWGQFIDHDLTLTRTDGVNDISVVVPASDPVFAPSTIIPITRAVIRPTTGAGTANPAIPLNTTTAWLDASMVYGFERHGSGEPAPAGWSYENVGRGLSADC